MKILKLLSVFVLIAQAIGCGGLVTLPQSAMIGETVAFSMGNKGDFNRDDITVTITPDGGGTPVVLSGNDPEVRALINFYPDPISNMLVSRAIGEDLSPFAQLYSDSLLFSAGDDKDYFQSTMFLDLPPGLPLGLNDIEISSPGATHTVQVNVIAGAGNPFVFDSDFNGGTVLSTDQLDSLSRAPHTIVSIDAPSIPSAVEINLTHDPDETVGGTGEAYVVNPLGYRKNLHWHDDGTSLKVILTEARDGVIDNLKDYKFYVAGTVTNLALSSVSGFDSNGDEIVGVTASLVTN